MRCSGTEKTHIAAVRASAPAPFAVSVCLQLIVIVCLLRFPAVVSGRFRPSGVRFPAGLSGLSVRPPFDRVQVSENRVVLARAWPGRRFRGCRTVQSGASCRPPRLRLASARSRSGFPALPSASPSPRFRSVPVRFPGFAVRLSFASLPLGPGPVSRLCRPPFLRLASARSRSSRLACRSEVPVYHPVPTSCSVRLLFVLLMVSYLDFVWFVSVRSELILPFVFFPFVSVRLELVFQVFQFSLSCVRAPMCAVYYLFSRILYT